MLNRFIRVFVLACAGLLLVACAGGGDSGLTAPTIVTHPADATVASGQTASFTVVATGSPSPSYQWRRNGVDIAGATSSSYVTPATALTDGGALYTVAVTNSQGAANSNAATLGVNAVTSEEKRSLLSVMVLTAQLYIGGLSPIVFVDDDDKFVDPTSVCLSGMGSPVLDGVPTFVGQEFPATGTLAATFTACSLGSIAFSGASVIAYDIPSLDPVNGTAAMTLTNMHVTMSSGGTTFLDYTANGSGTISATSASTAGEYVVTYLATPGVGSTVRNELNSLTAVFSGGTMTVLIGLDTADNERVRFVYDNLNTSIAGVAYVANGFHEIISNAQGDPVSGSGEVLFTANGTQVGRVYATAAGSFVEVDGVAQPLRIPRRSRHASR